MRNGCLYFRKGYGSLIKKALVDRCKQYGYHHLVAKIFATNTASIEYNKKFGYEIVGRQKEIGIKNGRWQDSVIMQLVLPDVLPGDLEQT
ncbi:MAG: GNAT family N-acetyltransferase [bacterium]